MTLLVSSARLSRSCFAKSSAYGADLTLLLVATCLWLTTTVNSETHAWAQRAASLAFFGVRGLWSLPRPPGATWAAVPIAPPLDSHDPDTCAVCLDDYSDRLPSHDDTSRSMPGHWITCAHCVCQGCIGRMGGARCPICRALRVRPALTFSA